MPAQESAHEAPRAARVLALAALSLVAGCQGTVPPLKGDVGWGYGAILVRGHVVTPAGETRRARLALNFESDFERFLVPFTPGQTTLYVVPPGTYRLMPLRGAFGITERTFNFIVENHTFRTSFPRDVLRKDAIEVRADRVVPIGVLEVVLERDPLSRKIQAKVRIDDSKQTRSQLVQDKINSIFDSKVSAATRDQAIRWTRGLDAALVSVGADADVRPPFKRR